MQKLLLIVFFILSSTLSAVADNVAPYSGSRIFWDQSTRKTVFSSGGYSRIIQLHDGRLMAVCESNGINIAFSGNLGATWSSPVKIVTNTNNTPNCVPDLIQLADGTIIVAYNPRPAEPYTQDRKFGIRCKRSTDNGVTWSDEIFIYDAKQTFADGCWEPSMLELPSGELQVYFADEGPYTTSNEQQISMCRSYDGGLTWSGTNRISFRAGYRDGMPSPVLLNDRQTIVVAIEDNGWQGYNDFFPTTVRCTLERNWKRFCVTGDSENRDRTLDLSFCPPAIGGAPYLRVLPWGETVLSWQSKYNHGSTNTMFTAVGDEQARGFKAMSNPFVTSLTDQALWNSVAVIDTGVVVAVGGINGRVEMIKGYPVRLLQAACGKPVVDGVATEGEGYMRSDPSQIMLGTQTGTQTLADFAYDEDSLYFIARTADPTFVSRRGTTDNVRLMIDADNVSSTSPQEGMYCFSFRRDAVCRAWHGEDGSWNETDASMINMKVTSEEQSYTVEAAIPWSALGKSEPPVGQRMAATVEIENVGEDATTTERIPDAQRNESWTYMEFRLAGGTVTDGIDKTTAHDGDGVDMRVSGGTLFISSSKAVREMTVCSADGRIVARKENPGTRFSTRITHKGIAVIRLTLSDGRSVSRKTAF